MSKDPSLDDEDQRYQEKTEPGIGSGIPANTSTGNPNGSFRQREVKQKMDDPDTQLEKPRKISKKSESTTALVELKKELGLWNGVGLIVGIMIGSGIFVSPGNVVRYTGSVGMSLVVWAATGFMCMLGAFCYAEMGTMIPKSGGTYAYILEAFGPVPAFLTLWINLVIQSPGSRAIGLITFANYLLQPFFPNCSSTPYFPVRLIALATLAMDTAVTSCDADQRSRPLESMGLRPVFLERKCCITRLWYPTVGPNVVTHGGHILGHTFRFVDNQRHPQCRRTNTSESALSPWIRMPCISR